MPERVFERVTPGGIVAVGDGGAEIETLPFGHLEPGGARVTQATRYDIASLTKPIATIASLMKLVARGDLELDTPALRWLPELVQPGASDIRLRHLAGHAAGFPAHAPLYERLWRGERCGASSAREALLRMIGRTELEAAPGQRAVYSDLGMIALGFVIERCTGQRLDRVVSELVAEPVGMAGCAFVDLEADPPVRPEPVAPTRALRSPRLGSRRGSRREQSCRWRDYRARGIVRSRCGRLGVRTRDGAHRDGRGPRPGSRPRSWSSS